MEIDLRSPAALIALASMPSLSQRQARELVEAGEFGAREHEDMFARAYARALASVACHVDANVRVLSYFDADYPARLRELRSAPNVLYVRGPVGLLALEPLVAVVGTRHPTVFGESSADLVTRAFARAGWATVSGLALGVDGICARASLEEGVPHIAVLGGGLDNVSPAAHRALARDILQCGGALVSEHPFGAPTLGRQLVARNRLQSGLARALVVAQSPVDSGTMHTARFAAEQRRPIYCPQPKGEHPSSEGNRVLLSEPASNLPDLAPAFARTSTSWQAAFLGDRPLASPITRENLDEAIETMASF